ncbi:MAG TPA: glycosyltransferase [Longimicrobiales bacterium]|nr:glycosyltransferase [Longimicrobiales bacterium]
MSATLSVCVIQFTSDAHLVRCLDALTVQSAVTEVLVPHDDTLGSLAALRDRFPRCRFVSLHGRQTPAALRTAATHAAGGEIIAFLEDHCVPAPDWADQLLEVHRAPHAAVGGAVDKGFPPGRDDDSALNWAVYFTDYSRYMNPQPGGPSHSLTDCNVSYKRADLEAVRDSWNLEFHENIVNEALAARGATLWLAPEVVVLEQRTLTLGGALRDRYAFGRLFASTRVSGAPLRSRLTFTAGSMIMPPILVARVVRNLFARRRHRAQLLRALPALLLVTSTWMLGEFVGYVTGAPAARLRPVAALDPS